jgi:hypothetical protein
MERGQAYWGPDRDGAICRLVRSGAELRRGWRVQSMKSASASGQETDGNRFGQKERQLVLDYGQGECFALVRAACLH